MPSRRSDAARLARRVGRAPAVDGASSSAAATAPGTGCTSWRPPRAGWLRGTTCTSSSSVASGARRVVSGTPPGPGALRGHARRRGLGGCRGRTVRPEPPGPAPSGLLLVAPEDLRVHGVRAPHRDHPAPAPDRDRPRRAGGAVLRTGVGRGAGRRPGAARRRRRASDSARPKRARAGGGALFVGRPLRASRGGLGAGGSEGAARR